MFLVLGIFLVVFAILFVLADSYDVAPSSTEAGNTISLLKFNVTNTTGTTGTNLTIATLELTGNVSIGNVTSVNISDGTSDYSNGSITGTTITIDVSNVNTSAIGTSNLTVNITLNSSATYGFALGLNITSITAEANATATPTTNSSSVFITETTAPTATAACSDVFAAKDFPCTCTGTDSGAAASGVSTSVGSSTSSDGITTPLTIGDFTYTCTVTDVAGNSATNTATYSILDSSGSRGGSTSSTSSLLQKKQSFAKITPGAVAIVKNFDSEIGLKEIQIDVNSDAQNVKVTVTKYDNRPAEVSVTKSGKVNQYLQIEVSNIEGKLDKATITARVEKSWVSNNGLKIDGVALFKFDEFREEWNELTTNYVGSEDNYYYYDAEVSSFSFFVIGEKLVVEEDTGIDTGTGDEEEGSLVWLWVLIGVLILIAIGWNKKRKK